MQVPGSAGKGPVIHQSNNAPRPLWWFGEQHRRNEGGKDSYFVSSVYIFHFPPALVSFTETLSIALFLPALCLFPAHPYNLVRKGGTESLRGGGMQGCSFLFLSHCVWRSVPLLISTVGTLRFERWEFKQRLQGHWQLWCSSHVCMFWNVKRTLRYCFRLCLSSPKNGMHFKHKRVLQKRGHSLCVWRVESLVIELYKDN